MRLQDVTNMNPQHLLALLERVNSRLQAHVHSCRSAGLSTHQMLQTTVAARGGAPPCSVASLLRMRQLVCSEVERRRDEVLNQHGQAAVAAAAGMAGSARGGGRAAVAAAAAGAPWLEIGGVMEVDAWALGSAGMRTVMHGSMGGLEGMVLSRQQEAMRSQVPLERPPLEQEQYRHQQQRPQLQQYQQQQAAARFAAGSVWGSSAAACFEAIGGVAAGRAASQRGTWGSFAATSPFAVC